MKGKTLLLVAVIGILITALGSCKADVDFSQLDKTVGADLGLALPIGEASATLGDFLGNGKVSEYIQVDDNGVIFFQDTFYVSRSFYTIDLSKYMSNATQRFDVGSKVGGVTLQKGKTYKLTFPLELTLNDINTNFDQERIDSIWMREARFTSNFCTENFSLPYNNITKLEIVLDDNFTRKAGKVIDIPLSGGNYNTDIPVLVDEFYLNLMKNRKQDPSNTNVINKVNFDFVFTIVPSANVFVPVQSAINYKFNIVFLHYHAIWGWFNPSNQMRDKGVICIADEWNGWNDIKSLLLPFAEPEIQMNVYTAIGAPLIMDGDYLYVKSAEPDSKPYRATFNGSERLEWSMPNYVNLKDDINTLVKNTYTFSEDPAHGHLDELFKTRPDSIAYSYRIYPNNTKAQADGVKHYRLSENTDLDLELIATLPFTFNEGTTVSYTDSIDSIHIESYQLDSLIAEIEAIKEAKVNTLKLIITATNYIPFNIHGEAKLYDENGQELNFGLTNLGNSLTFVGPTKVENGVLIEPGVSTFIIDITQEKYDELTRLHKMQFTASLGDNTTYVRVLDESGLKLRVALAADVSAVADLDALLNSSNDSINTEEVAQ